MSLQECAFQLIDIDQHVNSSDIASIRMFGRSSDGQSVLVEVFGFQTYFFMSRPPNMTDHQIMDRMNTQLAKRRRILQGVVSVQYVRKQDLMFSTSQLQEYVCIKVSSPNVMPALRTMIEKDRLFPGIQTTYESNVSYVMRFMVDFDIQGACWLRVRGATMDKDSGLNIQVHLDAAHHDVQAYSPEESNWQHIAPLRILSFDIECAGRKGIFPDPNIDSVIQIGIVLKHHLGHQESKVLTYRDCDPMTDATVMCYDTETELLESFRQVVCDFDPDILIGYNIINFDLPYLLERAQVLKLDQFACLGRIPKIKSQVRTSLFQSSQSGARESKEILIQGRLILDLYAVIQRNYKLRSYTLNSVCAHFLASQKEDVHYSEITGLFNGDSSTRHRLAVYCLKDSVLPLQLMDKLMVLYNYVEMSRVTGVPMNYLLTRGQQIKVISQIYRHARKHQIIVPVCQPQHSVKRTRDDSDDESEPGEGYEGATVLEPVTGYHQTPIATLDFQSLYPSIMIAHNLCYSTYVPVAARSTTDPSTMIYSPDNQHAFVRSTTRLGLLPQILIHLLQARDRAKKAMKATTDPMTKAVLDGRQLALKVSANSVYGFTGASVGLLPLVQIASTVTSFGRDMILQVKSTIEETYPGTVVIYGDTDSVMIKFGNQPDVEESMRLAKEAAILVSSKFVKPIQMVFEKVSICFYIFLCA
jgi:DNA polymerase delta subunit 1